MDRTSHFKKSKVAYCVTIVNATKYENEIILFLLHMMKVPQFSFPPRARSEISNEENATAAEVDFNLGL